MCSTKDAQRVEALGADVVSDRKMSDPYAALIMGMARALFTSKRCHFVAATSKRADLERVGGWLSQGLEVPIDSRHKIADLGAALKRQVDRSRTGRVVVDVAAGWPS